MARSAMASTRSLKRVGLAGGVITTGEHHWLDGTIEFRDGDLQGYSNGVQAQVTVFPFLGGLNTRGKGHHKAGSA